MYAFFNFVVVKCISSICFINTNSLVVSIVGETISFFISDHGGMSSSGDTCVK